MEHYEYTKFIGAREFLGEKLGSISSVINLAMNAVERENILSFPAENVRDLGEYFIDFDAINSEVIAGFDELESDIKSEITSLFSCQYVGEKVTKIYEGVFCGGAYTTITDELEQLYSGDFPVPETENFAFKLKLGKPQFYDEEIELTELKLPMDSSEIYTILNAVGDDAVCYECRSTVPKLDEILSEISEIDDLNLLAEKIMELKSGGELPKFKAMLETLSGISVETALDVADFTDDFTLHADTFSHEDFGRKLLPTADSSAVKVALHFVDLEQFGKYLACEHGAKITSYGFLESEDGLTLSQKIEDLEQNQAPKMELGGF